jgi:hypothetical protein
VFLSWAAIRPVTATWTEVLHLCSEKAVEGWVEADMRRMLDQISRPLRGAAGAFGDRGSFVVAYRLTLMRTLGRARG